MWQHKSSTSHSSKKNCFLQELGGGTKYLEAIKDIKLVQRENIKLISYYLLSATEFPEMFFHQQI